MAAIRVDGLTKRFGDLLAVDDLSFEVERGEFFGLLGPNGAGKTTLLDVLCTLLRPTAGSATVAGRDVVADPGGVRRRIGVVFQEPALDERLTAAENLRFHALCYGLDRSERRDRIDRVLALVDLADRRDTPVEEYSGGMKRRLEIARGLVHRPDVLFLDEPTLGLDALTRRRTWEYLRRTNAEAGVTVVLTTHYMEEADLLCDRVAICDRGRIAALDSPAALKREHGREFLTVEVESGRDRLAERLAAASWVGGVEAVGDEGVGSTLDGDGIGDAVGWNAVEPGETEPDEDGSGGTLRVTLDRGDRRIPALVDAATAVDAPVMSVDRHRPSLETVFLSLTGETLAERALTDRNGPRTIDSAEPDVGSVRSEGRPR